MVISQIHASDVDQGITGFNIVRTGKSVKEISL